MSLIVRTSLEEPETDAAFIPHRPERPPKVEGGKAFRIVSDYSPAGDQPTAIAELVSGINAKEQDQVLLGVTGSGKTFTMAKVIEATQRPALILAPNKTLAAQLMGNSKAFSLTMRSNISSAIMIIISRRPMFRAAIRSSKRNPASTKR